MEIPSRTRSGAQIGARAFSQSLLILLALMILAGLLTRIVPAGSYERVLAGGREVVLSESFSYANRPSYPVWRWFTAPLEVLGGPDGLVIITIIVFLMLVGASFAVMEKSGLLNAALGRIVQAFGKRKYLLLLAISFFFMLIGAFFGIFEEVVPLVPLMVALAYLLGWDALTGLGMSILATNLGFSAAVTNPFTIGIAQKLAELPLFSGALFRIAIFVTIYTIFSVFLTRYARRIERKPQDSPVYHEDLSERRRYAGFRLDDLRNRDRSLRPALLWMVIFLVLILFVLVAAPFLSAVSDYSLPLVGFLFFFAGVGSGWLAGARGRRMLTAIQEGLIGIAPAIPLILMAASIKHIVAQGKILDTLLYLTSQEISQASPFLGSVIVYVLALLIEFFIGSGSAKAFLMMPILIPLSDLIGITRQVAVTAYCFGDGFSNMVYPTNPVLLIALGLTVVSYPKWLKWTLRLWFWILLASLGFLALAVAINLGPY